MVVVFGFRNDDVDDDDDDDDDIEIVRVLH